MLRIDTRSVAAVAAALSITMTLGQTAVLAAVERELSQLRPREVGPIITSARGLTAEQLRRIMERHQLTGKPELEMGDAPVTMNRAQRRSAARWRRRAHG